MDDAALKVLDFQIKMGGSVKGRPSLNPSQDELRLALIREETQELEDALKAGDLVAVADAIADLKYVIEGTAITYGFDLEPLFNEVHRSNMTKEAKSGAGAAVKVKKGPSYEPPELTLLIGEQRLWGNPTLQLAEQVAQMAEG